MQAAGILFVAPDKSILLLKRSDTGEWALPGGGVEGVESLEAAAFRECMEELGMCPLGERRQFYVRAHGDVVYTTFLQYTERFDPILNHEHTQWYWHAADQPLPEPLHPGLAEMLQVRSYTTDKESMYYTVEQLGPKQSMTPEKYLLCEDVPIGRLGILHYLPEEVGIEPATPGGFILVERNEDQVFRPDAINSFNGKPITLDHPAGPVTPETWRLLSVGTVMHPRRGQGEQSDLMLADFLITDADVIKAILAKELKEVSSGYDCDYEEIGPGRGRQLNITGNHVAFVNKGRCGPRCAIGDKAMAERKVVSTTIKNSLLRGSALDRLSAAIATKDKAAADMALAEVLSGDGSGAGEAGETTLNIHMPNMEDEAPEQAELLAEVLARLDDMDGITTDSESCADRRMRDKRMKDAYKRVRDKRMADRRMRDEAEKAEKEKAEKEMADKRMRDAAEGKEPEPDEEDKNKGKGANDRAMTMDSSSLAGIYQETISRAEILSPGVRFWSFDAKASYQLTNDALCALRRKTLSKAIEDDKTMPIIQGLTGAKPDLTKMTCDQVTGLFNGAAELVRTHRALQASGNIHRASDIAPDGITTYGVPKPAPTPAELNAKARKFYAEQQKH